MDGRQKQDCLSALERLRNAVRTSLDSKSQLKFMGAIDQLATQINQGQIDIDAITSGLQQTKGTTRRILRTEPSTMLQILNCIDGIEQEIINFIQTVNRSK